MGEPKIPVFVAVGFWVASGLAVMGFTYVAFKETATGVENFAIQGGLNPDLVAASGVLSAELKPEKSLISMLPNVGGKATPAFKPLERGRFKGSK